MDEIRDRRNASWFWMDKAILDRYGSRIGAYGVAVYALLARHADNKGHAFPSLHGIAKTLGMSRRSVMRTLEDLENVGLLSKGHRKSETGVHTTNIYTLLFVLNDSASQSPPAHLSGASQSPQKSIQDNSFTGSGATQSPPVHLSGASQSPGGSACGSHKQDPQEEQEETHTGQQTSADHPSRSKTSVAETKYSGTFLQFWAIYPNKVGKLEAWRKWQSLKLNAIGERIVTSVQAHIDKDDKWRRGYIPNPAKFLNQGRWEDELGSARSVTNKPNPYAI